MMRVPGGRRLRRWLALRGVGEAVTVFQMAKVGSSAVVDAIERAGRVAFHVHRMDAAHLASMRAEREALGWLLPPVPAHDRLGLELRRRLVTTGRGRSFVTLVRDPIARNLSSYLEHLDQVWRTRDAHSAIPPEDLCRGFLERFPHSEPLTWFDDEMRPVLGIDVYRTPFPSEGHLVLEAPPFRLLILKSEIDDGAKRSALSAFLEMDVPDLRRSNETAAKARGAAYQDLVQRLRLPRAFVDPMIDARYTRHFYNDDERERIRNRFLSCD